MSKFLLGLISLLLSIGAYALEFPMPLQGDDIIGYNYVIKSKKDESLHDIARRADMGFYELIEANRKLVSLEPFREDTKLIIPMRFILPPGPRHGVVINLAEMRIYYYPEHGHSVFTYPIGIGRLGWATPTAETAVFSKIKDPTWYVPESIREDATKRGVKLPLQVPPGPENPLGKFAIRLHLPSYLVHGTNHPKGVGMRSSSGCIRLYPEDIKLLFEQVSVDTPVRIVNIPFKAGWQQGKLFLEAHQPLQEDDELLNGKHSLTPMVRSLIAAERDIKTKVDWSLAEQVAEAEQGLPVAVGEIIDKSI